MFVSFLVFEQLTRIFSNFFTQSCLHLLCVGFQLSAGKFFIYLLMLSLGVVALSSLAFLISAAIKNHSIAIVTFTLTHFIMLVSVLGSLSVARTAHTHVRGYVTVAVDRNQVLHNSYC